MKPLIIISPSISEDEKELKLSRAYLRAIRSAGGIPLVCGYGGIDDLLQRADGILLSGGGDIEPSLTGDIADISHQGQISKDRDCFELALARAAVSSKIPLLGICRGMQIIGAAFGAHIIQHMEGHMQTAPKDQSSHSIDITEGSMLGKILGKKSTMVNSFHHQAVGDGFEGIISAVSGFNEALELAGGFTLGVQWHPELLCSEDSKKIFEAFVDAAGRCRK